MNRRVVLLSGSGAFAVVALGGGLLRQEVSRPREAPQSTHPGARKSGPPMLGMNLTPINYYSPVAFMNRLKSSGPWSRNDRPAPATPLGYPTSLGGFDYINAAAICEAGRYVLTHDGDMDVEMQDSPVVSSGHGKTVFAVDGRYPGRLIYVRAIRRPPTSMHLVKEQHVAAFAAGEIFVPEFLAQVKGFDTLRFMEWMGTNGSQVTDRYTPVDAFSYAGGVPIEVMAALARKIGAHPWICIPHKASDELARSMIATVRSGMGDGPVPYIEYSNEVWNNGGEQQHYAEQQAAAMWGAGTSGLTYYGYRAGQLAKLARGSGCRFVLGCQPVVPQGAGQVWDGVRRAGAEDRDFAGWIIAAYVNGTLTGAQATTLALAARNDVAGAIDNIIHSVEPGALSVATMAPVYAAQGKIADAHGLDLMAYEGNMHLNALPVFDAFKPTVVPFFKAIVDSPAAGRVMDANLDAFAAAGGRLACLYNLSGAATEWGDFGLGGSGGWPVIQRRLAAPDRL